MKNVLSILFFIAATALLPQVSRASCLISTSTGAPARNLSDALAQVLSAAPTCPTRVSGLRTLLQENGLSAKPSMVANRGFHNSRLGSFSFFERVTGKMKTGLAVHEGEFFFGHFTTAENGQIALDQQPANGKLLIELIAWDPRKNLFNFYELIGTNTSALWFYRGDSADILADNRFLHQNPAGSPPAFGQRLRCSACHTSGGPIMKELSFPHNDWWSSARPLPLTPHKPNAETQQILATLHEANHFSQAVQTGILKLESSATYQGLKSSRSLAEQLRPVFCENEINLASSPLPNGKSGDVVIAPSFFVSPWFSPQALKMPAGLYHGLVAQSGMKFPETSLPDADHAWLTPVRSFSDELAVQSLLRQNQINEEFLLDVLSIDADQPLFSEARCSLLLLLPPQGGAMAQWMTAFYQNLLKSQNPAAKELAQNFSDPSRTAAFHRKKQIEKLQQWQQAVQTPAGAKAAFQKLIERRAKTFRAKISQNPRGQILEPGFRVIFPVPTAGAGRR